MSNPCVGVRASDGMCHHQSTKREGMGPSEEKECCNCGRCFHGRAWNRRSALDSACGGPSVRQSQMWNGDLNGPRAEATSLMIMGNDQCAGQQQSTSTNWKRWVNNNDESPLMGWQCWWQSPWSLGNAAGERATFVWRSGADSTLQTVKQWGCHYNTNLHLTQSPKIWIQTWIHISEGVCWKCSSYS